MDPQGAASRGEDAQQRSSRSVTTSPWAKDKPGVSNECWVSVTLALLAGYKYVRGLAAPRRFTRFRGNMSHATSVARPIQALTPRIEFDGEEPCDRGRQKDSGVDVLKKVDQEVGARQRNR